MMTTLSLSQTLAVAPNSLLNTPIVPGPHTSWVMRTSTLTQTLSPGWTDFLPDARAMIFSVSGMARIIRYYTGMVESWFFLESPAADAATNMAVDDVLLRTAAQRGRALLRVYAWLKPAISIGYFQKFPGGDNEVVRRPTGGGLVYHGDDTTFTVVVPPGHRLHKLTTGEAYCAIHEAVAKAAGATILATGNTPRGTYECFQQPVAGDVVADGRKLAGGAQRRN